MKKFFVEAEIEIVSISALDDLMAMASANGDFSNYPDGGWSEDAN